ncbi:ABC transporter permease [Arhodomonas aquaeolei]|uniref:ABC transporter permease n=1 Tax=Arhodomonas aquaeolei TaxID=2369 RepID=UPI00037BEE54|nr:ABC transporter permease [Arhodomonas aquaeolei]
MRGASALRRKALRDLWNLRGPMLAIALVLASGVAAYVGLNTTHTGLERTRDAFYRDYRFADVFVSLKRAPETATSRLAAIPGVASARTRVVARANLDVPGFPEPATAQLVSIPDGRRPGLNRLYLSQGRLPRTAATDEVVVSQSFAEAHGLSPGAALGAIINGRRQSLRVVGIGLSPEHIYQIRPGDILPDFERYAVMWMNRTPLATAYDMDGAFNSAVFTLTAGAEAAAVVDRVDAVVDRYGGLGAHPRADQISNRYLANEMHELGVLTRTIPLVFLAVAAFLLNVVVHRLVRNQREQIGILKAFGYRDVTIAMHYASMILAVAMVAAALGIALGGWMSHGMSTAYQGIFRFPFFIHRLDPATAVIAVAATAGAALAGALGAVRAAARLPPAEAMRPEPPPTYRASLLERSGLRRLLDQPTRMVVRHLARNGGKSALSVLGIAAAVGIMMLSRFGTDAIDYMLDIQFGLAQREDVTATFTEPTDHDALYSLAADPAVGFVEPFRAISVELVNGRHRYRTSILGLTPGSRLHRVLDDTLHPLRLPRDGVILTDYLREHLALSTGGSVRVRVLEGARPVLDIPVAEFAREYLGAQGYMRLDALNRRLDEGRAVSGAYLATGPETATALARRLQLMPRVAGVGLRRRSIESFDESMGRIMAVFTLISSALAGSIAFGVVYNSARIALSERSRELASLRVLGYSRGEVAYIILAELIVLTLAAIPPGFLMGAGLCWLLARGFNSDLYRIPLVIGPVTYGLAAATVLAAAALSAVLILFRLNRLSLVAALKTRE